MKIRLLLAVSFLLTHSTFAETSGEPACLSHSTESLRVIVAGRRDSVESNSLWQGTLAACEKLSGDLKVELIRLQYDEQNGFKAIQDAMLGTSEQPDSRESAANSPPHLILGPTESSLYRDLLNFGQQPECPIPVISPLVTAKHGNRGDDWYFRINVNASERAIAISDHLDTLSVKNIAVLYEDTEFGDASEMSFREVLSADQNESFQSYRYNTSNATSATDWLNTLAATTKPEAIGIFGNRSLIEDIARTIQRKSGSVFGYNPYLFTSIDVRPKVLEDMYFLSLATGNELDHGDPQDLSYDALALVLTLVKSLQQEGIRHTSEKFPYRFRSRLLNKLSDSEVSGSLTGLQFSGNENTATPRVYQVVGDQARPITSLDSERGVFAPIARLLVALGNQIEIRLRRFGSAVPLHLFLIALIVALTTIQDLRDPPLSVPKNDLRKQAFVKLIGFNILMAVTVYIVLAETDLAAFTWDSSLGAVGVAFSYAALLSAKIFTTTDGEAVFVRKSYQRIVKNIHADIRKDLYARFDPVINHISYANSLNYLRNALEASYGFDHSERKDKLIQELDRKLTGKTSIQQRRILAESLLDEMRDKTLQDRRIIPKGVARADVEDPVPKVLDIVEAVMDARKPRLEEVRGFVDYYQVHQSRITEFKEEFDNATTPRAQYEICFRWLIVLCGYNYFLKWAQEGFTKREFPITQLVPNDEVEVERRSAARIVYEAKVFIEHNDNTYKGYLCDLSRGGARLDLECDEMEADTELVLHTAGNGEVISFEAARARIIHQTDSPSGPRTLGVQWLDVSPRNTKELEYLTNITA